MRSAPLLLACLLLTLAVCGCKTPQALLAQQTQQQGAELAAQNRDLQSRLAALDKQNQQATESIAHLNRQLQLSQEQCDALREQLKSATTQIARLQNEYHQSEKQIEALQASARRRGGAAITPNNSLQHDLPELGVPGVEVRRDDAAVFVILPANLLFEPGDVRLRAEGAAIVTQIGEKIARVYPYQRIGVEGHTGGGPVNSTHDASRHQLSVAQAQAVFDELLRSGVFLSDQLRVVGHGDTRPLFSNGTPAGREKNQRVELVIYPEQVERKR